MENKYKRGIVAEVKQHQEAAAQQQRIRQKYNVDVPDSVIVVEKNNMVKFAVRMAIAAIKLIAAICLVILAFVGLISLIYPITRHDLIMIFQSIQNQLQIYINL